MRLRKEQVRALLEASRATRDVEIDCEEYLSRMAPYAEARAAGLPPPQGAEKVIEHERLCANCREETAALVEMIAQAKG
jgi:hypothetical protein